MDPTTTLVTFMFQTEPSVQSVRLIGSWDNFTMCYSMERDSRRGHGQWRGCFAFQNIMHAKPHHYKRSGGLKMGHTYFYYYEVDGSAETFDPTMPYTTACPYMPGQTVNTLQVPIERTTRSRSASMTAFHRENYRTMDPATKFMKPLPPKPLSPGIAKRRVQSAPVPQPSSSSSRSPSPRLWKRFFSRKLETSDSRRVPSARLQDATFTAYDNVITVSPPPARSDRHAASLLSEDARSRDISPSSLSRILREGSRVTRLSNHTSQLSPLKIPEDVIEQDEEDEDFAASAISESLPFATVLSPPPFQRVSSSEIMKHNTKEGSSLTTAAKPHLLVPPPFLDRTQPISAVLNEKTPGDDWAVLRTDHTPTGPPHEDVPLSFYDDEDDEDIMSSNEDEGHFPPAPISQSRLTLFKGYGLPRQVAETKDILLHQPLAYQRSVKLSPEKSSVLDLDVEAGLNNLISELRWIAATISIED